MKHEVEQLSYQIYVTDQLQAIAENTGGIAASLTDGKVGKATASRWITRVMELEEGRAAPTETRTPEEVVEHMKGRLAALSPG